MPDASGPPRAAGRTRYRVDRPRLPELVALVEQHVAALLTSLDGFRGAIWIDDAEVGEVIAVTLWTDRRAMAQSERVTSASRNRFGEVGAIVVRVDRLDVIASLTR